MDKLRMEDVQVDTYTNSSPIVHMRLTHLPTGTTVKGGGRSHHRLRKKLMAELIMKLEENDG
jgi:protein subunit release factor A